MIEQQLCNVAINGKKWNGFCHDSHYYEELKDEFWSNLTPLTATSNSFWICNYSHYYEERNS